VRLCLSSGREGKKEERTEGRRRREGGKKGRREKRVNLIPIIVLLFSVNIIY